MNNTQGKNAHTVRSIIYIIIIVLVVGGLSYFGFRAKNRTMTTSNAMHTLEGGLQYDITAEGTGPGIENGEVAVVNYTGTLENGTVFDSNVDPAFGHTVPFEFVVGGGMVIKGWDAGIAGMKVGEKRRLVIPAALAYGSRAIGKIPANSTLIFDVELTAIKHDN